MEEIMFHQMSEIPEKDMDCDNYSKEVLVYQLDPVTAEVVDISIACYNFNFNAWFSLTIDSIYAYCWAYPPIPTKLDGSWQPLEID